MSPAFGRSRYGFFPQSGTDYTVGEEPEIAKRLDALGQSLKLHLLGVSGYRSPAHSAAVGGFPDDPHTRGQASDTPGVESVPESVLERFGLTRPFPGSQEADHIQLLGGAKGSTAPQRTGPRYTLADLWKQAGGSPRLAPLMAAIAMAESGGKTDNVSPQNTDGTYDYGLWQINSSHTQFDPAKLTSDPLYNARAAVAIERTQGLSAWTTYQTGAYKSFMGSGSGAFPSFGRTRPGGTSSDSTDGIDAIFASYTQEGTMQDAGLKIGPFNVPIPGIPDPFQIFGGPAAAIKDTTAFLKWIAWIFHPRNVLRVVEFLTGLTVMAIGIQSMFEVWKGDPEKAAPAAAGRAAKQGVKDAIAVSPLGKAKQARKAAQFGRRQAQSQMRAQEAKTTAQKARVREQKRTHAKQAQRESRQAKRSRHKEDIPF